MARDVRLTTQEVQAALAGVPDWVLRDEAITRAFTFADFPAAIAFVGRVAVLAETQDHHPDIDIRYDTVTLTLVTHSAGGLTARDFALAAAADAAAAG